MNADLTRIVAQERIADLRRTADRSAAATETSSTQRTTRSRNSRRRARGQLTLLRPWALKTANESCSLSGSPRRRTP